MNTHKKLQIVFLCVIVALLAAIGFEKMYYQEAAATPQSGVASVSGLSACVWEPKEESLVLVDQASQTILLYDYTTSGFCLVGSRNYKWDILIDDSDTIGTKRSSSIWQQGIDVKSVAEWFKNPRRKKAEGK